MIKVQYLISFEFRERNASDKADQSDGKLHILRVIL